MTDVLSENFAVALKALRKRNGWSLQQAAEHTGLSKSMLGQIERLESSPTVATLWKIATGFKLSFSEISSLLFQQPDSNLAPIPHTIDDSGIKAKAIFPFEPQTRCEIFEITIQPGYQHLSPSHNPGITEHLLMLAGKLSILDGGSWRPIEEAGSYFLKADQEHGYKNTGDIPARFYLVMHYI